MGAADLLEDGFPHGTVEGYRAGCRGGVCPAPIRCRDAATRWSGDMTYRRRVEAGMSPVEIAAAEAEDARRAREQERAAARAELLVAAPKERRAPKEREHNAREKERRERARANRPAPTPIKHGTLEGYAAGCFKTDCPATPSCADVNLAHHGKPREKWVVWPRGPRRSRWDSEPVKPHGTNAGHARGCRTHEDCPNVATGGPSCLEAHKAYMREYRAARRAQPVPAEKHGTRYGYALGCRAGAPCPASPSCAEVEAAADLDRRRRRGVPERAPLVDAEPVRVHVRGLMAAGMSVAVIASTAGVSLSGVKTLMYGRSGTRKGEVPRSIKEQTARRLLALEARAGRADRAAS